MNSWMMIAGLSGVGVATTAVVSMAIGEDDQDIIPAMEVARDAGSVKAMLERMDGGTLAASMGQKITRKDKESLHFTTYSPDGETVISTTQALGIEVLQVRAHIRPASSSTSTVNIVADIPDHLFLSSNEVRSSDIEQLEMLIEVVATEYVMAQLEQRPLANSKEEFRRIYGDRVYNAIERIDRGKNGPWRRMERAAQEVLVGEFGEPGADDPGAYFREIERDMKAENPTASSKPSREPTPDLDPKPDLNPAPGNEDESDGGWGDTTENGW